MLYLIFKALALKLEHNDLARLAGQQIPVLGLQGRAVVPTSLHWY